MSEEILKALMQLFAILTKQDGGVEEDEKKYVRGFLDQQLGEKDSDEYYQLFVTYSAPDEKKTDEGTTKGTHKLTSVLDSVRILGICKKINKTLNQSQKVVVLVRLFELVSASMKLTRQRLSIIDTVAEVFRIGKEIRKSMETFILHDPEKTHDQNILVISGKVNVSGYKHIQAPKLDSLLTFLRIPDENLYFIKYSGNEDLFLNGLTIHRNRIYHFAKGSTVKVPKGKPVYYTDVASHFLSELAENPISFDAEKVEYQFRNGDKGLQEISFSAMQGNLIGILGASGSGKTTLLNVLSGIYHPSSGNVRINGIDVHTGREELNGVIGYIPQDDLLIEELTVFENLYFNAKLCFRDMDEDSLKAKVDLVLSNLGLINKKNLKVGSPFNKTISGGQRKRLNIALELIREPSVLFVDEPTSGLSSRDSENVMDLLRELTLKGKLIFVVIHQPSSEIYKMFDNVIILDAGGYMVYSGNPVEAVMYFKRLDAQINSHIGECPVCGNVNPELIFNILEAKVVDEYGNYTSQRKVSPEKWQEYFNQHSTKTEAKEVHINPPKMLNIPGWVKQLRVFTVRDFLSKISNRQYLAITLLEAPVLAFILSYIIRYIADPSTNRYIFRENENIPIYIFMALIVALFIGLTVSAEEIFRDRKILKREKFLNLSRSAYLVSKIAILTLISAIQAAAFVLVANNIIELREMTFYYWFAFFTTAMCANLLGLNISASFNSAITIYILIPLVIIPMMVLSGAMFSFDKLNRTVSRLDKVPLLAELMPTKWSYEALMVKQFKDNKFQKNFYRLDKKITNSDFQLSYYLPELENRLNKCAEDFNSNEKLTYSVNDFMVLINELKKVQPATAMALPLSDEILTPGNFNPDIEKLLNNYISDVYSYYQQIFISADKEKTNRLRYLMDNQRELYFSLLDKHHNESVSDQVRKIYEKNKLVEYKLGLVRLTDPIFLDPGQESFIGFRSHFFAPRKYFMGRFYDTYWFNMTVIWVLIILLYMALYYGILKKLTGN